MWRFWGLSPYDRVRVVLAHNLVPCGIRQLSKLARVSPQTAKRVGDELVAARQAGRVRDRGARTVRYVLKRETLRTFRDELGRLPLQSREDQIAFLATTDAPIWLLGPTEYEPWGVYGVPDFVAIPRSWYALVPHPPPYVVFEAAGPLERAREELPGRELLVALLKLTSSKEIHQHLAREMYGELMAGGRDRESRQRRRREQEGLTRRLRQERLVAAARVAGISID